MAVVNFKTHLVLQSKERSEEESVGGGLKAALATLSKEETSIFWVLEVLNVCNDGCETSLPLLSLARRCQKD
jgi:hypothetical protein